VLSADLRRFSQILPQLKQQQQQQQQAFNGLCSGRTRVGRYQKKHPAFCLRIGLCCVQAGFPHFLSSGFLKIFSKNLTARIVLIHDATFAPNVTFLVLLGLKAIV